MKTDIQTFINLLFQLDNIAADNSKISNTEKLKVLKNLYLFENYIHSARVKLNLPQLDNKYYSESIIQSFTRQIPQEESNNRKTFVFNDYLRAIDYQYYLLGFLLLENNHINPGNLMLHQIISNFLERIKTDSLKYEDIIRTESGATRCQTNLRFAMQSLRDAGLIKENIVNVVKAENIQEDSIAPTRNLPEEQFEVYNHEIHNKKGVKSERTWALSYLGFWVSISFMLNPIPKRLSPSSKNLKKTTASNYFLNTDPIIWRRIDEIRDKQYFVKLWDFVEAKTPLTPTQDPPEEIINSYFIYYSKYADLAGKERKSRLNWIKTKIEELEHRNNLKDFMQNIAENFNANEVFKI